MKKPGKEEKEERNRSGVLGGPMLALVNRHPGWGSPNIERCSLPVTSRPNPCSSIAPCTVFNGVQKAVFVSRDVELNHVFEHIQFAH